jgi:RES domain-containing protein
MRLWRISNYADLSGMGGVRFSARWHTRGRPILYAAEHPAGALVEFLAHLDLEDIPDNFQLITIEIDGAPDPATINPADLPNDWPSNRAVTREAGDRWLEAGESLLLRVPSVLVPDARNVLINPAHPDVTRMRITKTEEIPLDHRLARR